MVTVAMVGKLEKNPLYPDSKGQFRPCWLRCEANSVHQAADAGTE